MLAPVRKGDQNIMIIRRRLSRGLLSIVATLTMLFSLTGTAFAVTRTTTAPQHRAASAASPSTTSSPSAIAVVSAHQISTSSRRTPAYTITCTLKINDPHRSTHNPAKVNVVTTWKCTGIVTSLSMTVKLYTFAGVQQASDSFKKYGKKSLSGNAASACIPDYYYGTASETVVYPPGFTPPKATLHVRSATRPVACI
jgi:hypothetical protein